MFSEYHSTNLKIMVLNPTFAQSELIRSGFLIMPAIVLGFFIMVCVSVSTVLLSATYFRQVSIHKVSHNYVIFTNLIFLGIFGGVCMYMSNDGIRHGARTFVFCWRSLQQCIVYYPILNFGHRCR